MKGSFEAIEISERYRMKCVMAWSQTHGTRCFGKSDRSRTANKLDSRRTGLLLCDIVATRWESSSGTGIEESEQGINKRGYFRGEVRSREFPRYPGDEAVKISLSLS